MDFGVITNALPAPSVAGLKSQMRFTGLKADDALHVKLVPAAGSAPTLLCGVEVLTEPGS